MGFRYYIFLDFEFKVIGTNDESIVSNWLDNPDALIVDTKENKQMYSNVVEDIKDGL